MTSTGTPARTDIPGPRGLPWLGQTLDAFGDAPARTRRLYETYGPVVRTTFIGMRVVNALGTDAAAEVLANRDRAFANGPGWSPFIGPFFHRGLMLLDGDEHLMHRRTMQAAFSRDRLRGYVDTLNPVVAGTLATWQPGDGFRAYDALKQLTLDVATRTFVDGTLDARADAVNRAFTDCVRAATAVVRLDVPPLLWHRALKGRRLLEDYVREQLPARRAGSGEDLLSALCQARGEEGETFSDDDVVNHMIFLLMAAHDTSTSTLSTMVYHLARDQQWQERCRAEALARPEQQIGADDIAGLVDIDLAMKEAMRLVTPVPSVLRRAEKDTTVGGWAVPAGTLVSAHLQLSHTIAEHWTDPLRFDPDRFAEGRREDKRHRHAFEPFGGGVHKCIGMHFAGLEVKATMYQLLRTFRWSVAPGYRMPLDHVSLPKPKDGLPVRLERLVPGQAA